MHATNISDDIAKNIKEQTWAAFTSAYTKKYKKPYHQSLFTVVASISLVDSTSGHHECVSIGFGTKSLPSSVMSQCERDDLLCDMHAEMLAIQGFKRFLLKEVSAKNVRYLEWNEKKSKHQIKNQFGVYLYCSEIFCGDCCIDQNEESFSGAKPLKYITEEQYPKLKYQPNILRTKPGRIDLPVNKRSHILSCSDKIGLFNLVGIQGKELFSLITPFYLHTIILEGSPSLKASIERGIDLIVRLTSLRNKPWMTIFRQIFNIIINGKERKISSQFHHNKPNLIILPKQPSSRTSRDQEGFELCGIISEGECQWINGRTGLPEGSSIKNYKSRGRMSRFSESKMREEFAEYRQGKDTFKYQAVEERLKILFKQWV